MVNVSGDLQERIKKVMVKFEHMFNESVDLENLYFKGGVSGDISGLADGDAATNSTALTKLQLVNSLTFASNVSKFFNNEAATQADFMVTCQDVIYGNAAPSFLNNGVEAYGSKAVQFARDSIDQYDDCRIIDNIYVSSKLAAVAGVLDDEVVIYGAQMTRKQLVSAVNLCRQWIDFLSNVAISPANRRILVGHWYGL